MPTLQYEPKKNNRFFVEFPEQFNVRAWSVQKINKPKFTDGKWEDIKVEFIDVITPSTSQSLFKIVNFLQMHKPAFDVKIKSLGPVHDVVEEWVISVEKVLTINFGDFDYSDDTIQRPYMILKPLNCILQY